MMVSSGSFGPLYLISNLTSHTDKPLRETLKGTCTDVQFIFISGGFGITMRPAHSETGGSF